MDPISLIVNLPGVLGGRVKHTTKQVGSVDVSLIGSKTPQIITRKILHTDRTPVPCGRYMIISTAVQQEWEKSSCPTWANPKTWKTLSKRQKVVAFLFSFDEGYGISFE